MSDLKAVASTIKEGTLVALTDVLKAVTVPTEETNAPAVAIVPTPLTHAAEEAAQRLPSVFGSVQPLERRTLTPSEVTALYEERVTIDTLKDEIETRRTAIRHALFSHFDVLAEEIGVADDTTPRDADGHYLLSGEVAVDGAAKRFTRELRESSPSLTVEALQALEEAGEITHDEFLSMTTPVRVVDENKVMLVLKQRADLIDSIAKAATPGKRTAACYLRNAKKG